MDSVVLEKPKVKKDTAKFEGKVFNWNVSGERKYILGAMRYGRLRQFIKADTYHITNTDGEQRDLNPRHVKKLQETIISGKYVPTVFSLGTKKNHRDSLQYTDNGKNVSLLLELGEKLSLIDANHRYAALENIRSEGGKTTLAVDNVHIPYIMYLDGDKKQDFLALQEGMPVNKSHIMSMKITNGLMDKNHSEFYKMALETAKILHSNNNSPFKNLIRFDSKPGKLYSLAITTLATKKATDLIFSLYGSAKIAIQYGKDAEWLANMIDNAYYALIDTQKGAALMADNKLLKPAPDGAKIGSYYLIALGNSLAARCLLLGTDDPDEDDLKLMVDTAVDNLNLDASSHTTGKNKYTPYFNFAQDFFADLQPSIEDMDEMNEEELDISPKMLGFHHGIPTILINCLSPSTFGVSELPKQKKERKTKAIAKMPDEELTDDEEYCKIKTHVDDPDFDEEEGDTK